MSRISKQEYDIIRGNGWAAASNFITVATQAEYENYFCKVSRGTVVPPLTRYVNTDGIGYAAIVPPHIRLPQPPTPDYSLGVYSTQSSTGSSSQSSQCTQRFNWTADVAAPDGATITIEVSRGRYTQLHILKSSDVIYILMLEITLAHCKIPLCIKPECERKQLLKRMMKYNDYKVILLAPRLIFTVPLSQLRTLVNIQDNCLHKI